MSRFLAACLMGLLGTGEAAPADLEVRVIADIAFLAAGRTERLDLYLPVLDPDARPLPAVVMIHGGGWTGGDKAQAREQSIGRTLARAGYVMASINYRLGANSFPENVLDAKNAVRFLRAHAAEYRVDPERIAVMGGSAGGHLALMVAYTEGMKDLEPEQPYPGVSSRVRAVIDLYGPTNLLTRQEVTKEGKPTGVLRDANTPEVLGATRTGNQGLWQQASPTTHVRKDVPPTLILHGKADDTVDYEQSIELARTLERAGAIHELVLVDGVGHTFDLTTWQRKPMVRDLRPVVLEFIRKHVGAGYARP